MCFTKVAWQISDMDMYVQRRCQAQINHELYIFFNYILICFVIKLSIFPPSPVSNSNQSKLSFLLSFVIVINYSDQLLEADVIKGRS